MRKIILYFKRIYRLLLSSQKHEELVWKNLKKIFDTYNFRYGVYENAKTIELVMEFDNGKAIKFDYMIYNYYFNCSANVLYNFPVELTNEIFILATHFNNLLSYGSVTVNVNDRSVSYNYLREILIPLLYTDEIYAQVSQHHHVTLDVSDAFERLIEEQEAPAIIIADLLKKLEEEKKTEK